LSEYVKPRTAYALGIKYMTSVGDAAVRAKTIITSQLEKDSRLPA